MSAPRLIHLVLFKFKPDAPEEKVKEIFTEILALKGKIPEILEVSVGVNITDRSKGFTHGISVIFKDTTDLQTYQVHPAHQRVVTELIMPIKEDILALDYIENKF